MSLGVDIGTYKSIVTLNGNILENKLGERSTLTTIKLKHNCISIGTEGKQPNETWQYALYLYYLLVNTRATNGLDYYVVYFSITTKSQLKHILLACQMLSHPDMLSQTDTVSFKIKPIVYSSSLASCLAYYDRGILPNGYCIILDVGYSSSTMSLVLVNSPSMIELLWTKPIALCSINIDKVLRKWFMTELSEHISVSQCEYIKKSLNDSLYVKLTLSNNEPFKLNRCTLFNICQHLYDDINIPSIANYVLLTGGSSRLIQLRSRLGSISVLNALNVDEVQAMGTSLLSKYAHMLKDIQLPTNTVVVDIAPSDIYMIKDIIHTNSQMELVYEKLNELEEYAYSSLDRTDDKHTKAIINRILRWISNMCHTLRDDRSVASFNVTEEYKYRKKLIKYMLLCND